nr:uncharacterized protein LOC127326227 isoform X2 [Lolium perenne]XP_051209051.1 uncharacterized protein LOC127326227 isoform X2 [Lolium perenne]
MQQPTNLRLSSITNPFDLLLDVYSEAVDLPLHLLEWSDIEQSILNKGLTSSINSEGATVSTPRVTSLERKLHQHQALQRATLQLEALARRSTSTGVSTNKKRN